MNPEYVYTQEEWKTIVESSPKRSLDTVRLCVEPKKWIEWTRNTPTVWEERWKIKRWVGYTFIFYVPKGKGKNHPFKYWRRWCVLAVFKADDDARTYLETL